MRGQPLRAGSIAAAAGLSTEKSKIEGLRSKLKRLVERGWRPRTGPGCSRCPLRCAGCFTPARLRRVMWVDLGGEAYTQQHVASMGL